MKPHESSSFNQLQPALRAVPTHYQQTWLVLWLHCPWSPCSLVGGRSTKSELQFPSHPASTSRASAVLTYHFCFALQCSANDFIGLEGRSPGNILTWDQALVLGSIPAGSIRPSSPRGVSHRGAAIWVQSMAVPSAVFAAGSAGVVVGLLCHPTTFCNPTFCCLLSSRYSSKIYPRHDNPSSYPGSKQ